MKVEYKKGGGAVIKGQRDRFNATITLTIIITGVTTLLLSSNLWYYDIADRYNKLITAKDQTPKINSVEVDFLDTTNKAFYYNNLSMKMKTGFTELYEGIAAHQTKISLSVFLDKEEINRVMHIISFDAPELFSLAKTYTYDNRRTTVVYPKYNVSQSEYLSRQIGRAHV